MPDIKLNFSDWYNEIVYRAQLADLSPVRGCMVIRPYGYALWENIRDILDARIKITGHENASFPLLIPQSFLEKEADHVEGFAPELAVVTYAGGKKLDEPLVVRPTSETIIHYMFAQWMKSWRDLPLKINQWANVVRWEMRTRPFLRTTEFLWQEGHTAHESLAEAEEEVLTMLNEYVNLAEHFLAIPVVTGLKSESEKFPGAVKTFAFEAQMQDGKALQMGTSHLLSQSFAKAFNMQFQDREGKQAFPYLTSWGVTTRLIGALVMVHGDDKGLVMPPRVAPIQVVIVPIMKKDVDAAAILEAANQIAASLDGVRVLVDSDAQKTPGAKFYNWEMKGVPVRVEIGPRDLANGQVVLVDRLGLGKQTVAIAQAGAAIKALLDTVQTTMFTRAKERMMAQWFMGEKLADFAKKLEENNGFYQTGWCGDPACEEKLKEHKATTRCLLDSKVMAQCFNCDKPSKGDVLVAKAY